MVNSVFVRDLNGVLNNFEFKHHIISGKTLYVEAENKFGIPIHVQRLTTFGGQTISCDSEINLNETTEISLLLRVDGGKGGFGSMLRAMGKGLAKTTNFGAQRDLTGRRVRDIESDKALREWETERKHITAQELKLERKQIQREFKSIKETGRTIQKQMCPFGDDCRYMWKCRYRHPCDIEQEKIDELERMKEKKRKRPLKESFGITDDPIADLDKFHVDLTEAFRVGLARRKRPLCPKVLKEPPKKRTLTKRKHSAHAHELKYGVRPFSYIMCDKCNAFFQGASWHCIKGCDFDLCASCCGTEHALDETTLEQIKRPHKKKKNLKRKRIQRQVIEKHRKNITSLESWGIKVLEKEIAFQEIEIPLDLLFPDLVLKKPKKLSNQEQSDASLNYGIDLSILSKYRNNAENEDNQEPPRNNAENEDTQEPTDEPPKKKQKMDHQEIKSTDFAPIDLTQHNVNSLATFGLDHLKQELKRYGLKCGGNLTQRVERLILIKTAGLDNIPKKHFAKKKKAV